MILHDEAIIDAMEGGKIEIDPYPDPDQIQPASVDLRLGQHFNHPFETGKFTAQQMTLEPGECLLARTEENIKVPDDMVAFVTGRSTVGRMFVTVHQTAGLIDPGYEGWITLEVANSGELWQRIEVGERIAQIWFVPLAGESSGYDGQYGGDSIYPEPAGDL